MNPEFVLAQQADLAKIVEIYNQTIPTRMATADLAPVSVASKQAWFDAFNEKRPIWLICVDLQIAGWVSLEAFYGRPAYLHTAEISIYFDQAYRSHGLGQKTLNFVFNQLDKLEIKTVLAFIFSHNIPSQSLFKKNRFEKWGHLPGVALMDGVKRDLDILGRTFN